MFLVISDSCPGYVFFILKTFFSIVLFLIYCCPKLRRHLMIPPTACAFSRQAIFARREYFSLCACVSVSSPFSQSFQSMRVFPQLSGAPSPSSSSIFCRSCSLSSSNFCCRFAFRFSFFFLFFDNLPICIDTQNGKHLDLSNSSTTVWACLFYTHHFHICWFWTLPVLYEGALSLHWRSKKWRLKCRTHNTNALWYRPQSYWPDEPTLGLTKVTRHWACRAWFSKAFWECKSSKGPGPNLSVTLTKIVQVEVPAFITEIKANCRLITLFNVFV